MKIMSSYSGLTKYPSQKVYVHSFTNITGDANMAQLKYKIPIENCFKYFHAVDRYSNLRHSKPSLGATWVTQRWSNRAFSFLLSISEANFYLAFQSSVWSKQEKAMPLLPFWKKLAYAFIENIFWSGKGTGIVKEKERGVKTTHGRLHRPMHQNSNAKNGFVAQRRHTSSIAAEATNAKNECAYIVHVT